MVVEQIRADEVVEVAWSDRNREIRHDAFRPELLKRYEENLVKRWSGLFS
jgi:hypothetical protein